MTPQLKEHQLSQMSSRIYLLIYKKKMGFRAVDILKTSGDFWLSKSKHSITQNQVDQLKESLYSQQLEFQSGVDRIDRIKDFLVDMEYLNNRDESLHKKYEICFDEITKRRILHWKYEYWKQRKVFGTI